MEKIKLVCIPYAGGSAQIFYKWRKHLNSHIELIPVELTGRGKRFLEPYYSSIQDAVNDIYKIVKPQIQNSNYAIFGHSLGSILAYELIYLLKNNGIHNPIHVFFSGRYPPHIHRHKALIHNSPNEIFKKEIFKLGGTPLELLENDELYEIFMPILRSDYKIVETYNYTKKSCKFDFDISVFSGFKDNEVEQSDLQEWKYYTDKNFKIVMFEGGHFFINEELENVTNAINVLLKHPKNN